MLGLKATAPGDGFVDAFPTAALASLPPKHRAVLALRELEGLSYEEIASVLGCSKGTVASRLNRGHRALARKLNHLRHEVE